jgi:hypothetical protein
MRAHVCDPVPDPKAINPNIPETWRQICMRLMAKSPGERYANCQALRIAIADAVKKPEKPPVKTIIAEPERKRQNTRRHNKQRRQNKVVYATYGIGIGAVAIITLIVSVIWLNIDTPESDASVNSQGTPLELDQQIIDTLNQGVTTTPSAITIIRQSDPVGMRARKQQLGDQILVDYGTTIDQWYLQDFAGENMSITNGNLIWRCNETFKEKAKFEDVTSLQWKYLLLPPFSMKMQINVRTNTHGLKIGLIFKSDDESLDFAALAIDNTLRKEKCLYGIYAYDKNRSKFSFIPESITSLPYHADTIKTIEMQVNGQYEVDFFLDDKKFGSSVRIENGKYIYPFFLVTRQGSGETVTEIKNLQIKGVLGDLSFGHK